MNPTAKALKNSIVPSLLACLVCSQTCLAQVDPWERVKLIEPGKKVSVKLHADKSVNGKMDAWRPDGLSVRQGGAKVVSVEKSDVAQVALVTGWSRGRKALVAGLITGGVVGGLTGAALANCCDVAPALAAGAGGFWGGVAAGIAALFPQHHEVIYSAPAPSGRSSGGEP
jgi:hypothetical protein